MKVARWLDMGKAVGKDPVGALRYYEMAAEAGVPEGNIFGFAPDGRQTY